MTNKYFVYNERKPVAETISNAEIQEKSAYWRTLFNDDQDWLNKSISIFTGDSVELLAKSSLTPFIEWNTGKAYHYDHWMNVKDLFSPLITSLNPRM